MPTVDQRASAPAGALSPVSALPADRLERLLGRPRADWSVEDLVAAVRDHGIRLVSLAHVGGDGALKTLDFVPAHEAHLRDILTVGERADGSSLFTGLRSGASDIMLRPRPETAFLDPFSPLPTLVVLCGHLGRDGQPLPESPDTILRRAHARVRDEAGVDLWALGEIEYFLGGPVSPDDPAGAEDRGYHAAAPVVFGEALRREALVALAEIGIPVKYGHSEVGVIDARDREGRVWEQHEIELSLAPLPRAADAVVLTRWVLQNLAGRHGFLCSFEPIVREGHPGNGMHFHFSPRVEGEHTGGVAPDGSLSEPARWLIGGLARMGGALMAFGNRGTGSLLRLRQGKEAPNSVVWGQFDRQALIRLPITAMSEGGHRTTPPTIEFRLPDGSAHAHLLLAGIAQAVMLGRETEDLDGLIRRTASARSRGADPGAPGASPEAPKPAGRAKAAAGAGVATAPGSAYAIPRTFAQVAAALAERRAVLEAGGVFTPAFVDQVLASIG